MKFLFDIFPVVLFFAAYIGTGDIYTATAVAMVATLVQVIYAKVRHGKVDPMLWVSLAVILLLGALTLLLKDKRFIMWKPTIVYWLLAGAFLVASVFLRKNLVRALFAKAQLNLPEPLWARLNLVWVAFFVGMGALNLYVAYNFTEAFWVNFKLFGTLGITFVFFLAHGPLLMKYVEDKGPSCSRLFPPGCRRACPATGLRVPPARFSAAAFRGHEPPPCDDRPTHRGPAGCARAGVDPAARRFGPARR